MQTLSCGCTLELSDDQDAYMFITAVIDCPLHDPRNTDSVEELSENIQSSINAECTYQIDLERNRIVRGLPEGEPSRVSFSGFITNRAAHWKKIR